LEENEEQRGMELAQLLTDLGPTFIKREWQMQGWLFCLFVCLKIFLI
jgi:hypothetical protein